MAVDDNEAARFAGEIPGLTPDEARGRASMMDRGFRLEQERISVLGDLVDAGLSRA